MDKRSLNNEKTRISAVKGSMYFLFLAWASTGIFFIMNIILARILFPADFGIYTLSFTIIGIFSMVLGLGASLGVIHSDEQKDKLFSTFFFIELITIFIVSALLFCLSRPLANSFGDVRLESTLQVLIIFVVSFGFTTIPKTKLLKETQFKKITLIDVFSIFVSVIVSLSLALTGFGFWSLIIGPLVASLTQAIIYWGLTPIYPKFSQFNFKIFKTLLIFGLPILISSFVVYLNSHLADVIIAQITGLTFLGYYSLAYNFSNYLATLISDPVTSALYPVYCEIQKNKDELRTTFEEHYKMIFVTIIFIAFYILFNAPYAISILYGPKWLNSIIILQILIIAGLFRALGSIVSNIYLLLNKYYIVLILNSIFLGLMLPLTIFATIYFGIIGAAAVGSILIVPIITLQYWFLKKYFTFKILKDSLICLFGCLLTIPPMVIVIYYFNTNPILVLLFNFGIAISIYLVSINLLTKGVLTGKLKEMINIFLRKQTS